MYACVDYLSILLVFEYDALSRRVETWRAQRTRREDENTRRVETFYF